MKKIYYLCLLVGITLGSFTFTACGDDNDITALGLCKMVFYSIYD